MVLGKHLGVAAFFVWTVACDRAGPDADLLAAASDSVQLAGAQIHATARVERDTVIGYWLNGDPATDPALVAIFSVSMEGESPGDVWPLRAWVVDVKSGEIWSQHGGLQVLTQTPSYNGPRLFSAGPGPEWEVGTWVQAYVELFDAQEQRTEVLRTPQGQLVEARAPDIGPQLR